MKKILILANKDGGLYNFRLELIEKLLEEKKEVYISLPYGDKVEELKKLGCKFIETNVDRRGMNPLADLKLLKNYFKIFKTVKPDVVLTYTIKPNIYGGLVSRIKKVEYIPNITGLGTAMQNKSLVQKMLIKLYKISLKKAKCVFIQNESNKDFLIQNKIISKDSNYKVIPGSGVNLNKFKLLKYPSENKPIEFLFIARIMKEKGIDEYLEAARAIKKKYPNTIFKIIGDCEEEKYNNILQEEQDKGNIIYEGVQSDIISYLKNTWCLIHPSYYPEGISNVCLEAAASGRPVITTDNNGCKETVDDKITGYIFPKKNKKQLVKTIEMFIVLNYDLKKDMGKQSRKKIQKQFDRNIVIDTYINKLNYNFSKSRVHVYKKIIKSKKIRTIIIGLLMFLPDKVMIKIQYFIKTGRKLDLTNPKRFTEKIQYYKLYYRNPLILQCADKYLVRDYIIKKGHSDILNDLYGAYENENEIDFEKLPEKFVIKTSNGSHTNIICLDKNNLNIEETKLKINGFMTKRYNSGREWAYNSNFNKIIIEKLIETDDLIDYKFMCFNGKIFCYYVITNRNKPGGIKLNIFDVNNKKLPYKRSDIDASEEHINIPQNIDEMKKIAEDLSKDFPHVRVDLYNVNGKIIFGELTFYDGSGYEGYDPDLFDFILGDSFNIYKFNQINKDKYE